MNFLFGRRFLLPGNGSPGRGFLGPFSNDSEPNNPLDIFSTDVALWYQGGWAITASAENIITNWKDRVSGSNATGSSTVEELVSGTLDPRNRLVPDWSTNNSGGFGADVDGLDSVNPNNVPVSSYRGTGGIVAFVIKTSGTLGTIRTAVDSCRAVPTSTGIFGGINVNNQLEIKSAHGVSTNFLFIATSSVTASYGDWHWAICRHSTSLGNGADWELYWDSINNKVSGVYNFSPTLSASSFGLVLGGASRNTTCINLHAPLAEVVMINETGSVGQINALAEYLDWIVGR